jgi:hypothetical protein
VEQILRENENMAPLWIKRGMDQRYVGGWGIESFDGKFAVVCFANGRKFPFEDRLKACAEFIVRYLGFIGEVQARTKNRAQRSHAA